jgi:hypothetical protein
MKYRKKPVVIEAVQFTDEPDRIIELQEFMNAELVINYNDTNNPKLKIATLEGVMDASVGDYIIKGVKGEFYPCKPDIFHKTYEPVEDDGPITPKQSFLSGFDNKAYREVEVEVTVPDCPRTERIINTAENFAGKQAYYEKAYNDNLELKSFPAIKIVNYKFR